MGSGATWAEPSGYVSAHSADSDALPAFPRGGVARKHPQLCGGSSVVKFSFLSVLR